MPRDKLTLNIIEAAAEIDAEAKDINEPEENEEIVDKNRNTEEGPELGKKEKQDLNDSVILSKEINLKNDILPGYRAFYNVENRADDKGGSIVRKLLTISYGDNYKKVEYLVDSEYEPHELSRGTNGGDYYKDYEFSPKIMAVFDKKAKEAAKIIKSEDKDK